MFSKICIQIPTKQLTFNKSEDFTTEQLCIFKKQRCTISRKVLLNLNWCILVKFAADPVAHARPSLLFANSCFTAKLLFLGGASLLGYSFSGGSRWRDGSPPNSQRLGHRDSGTSCRSRSKWARPQESPECVMHSRSSWDLEGVGTQSSSTYNSKPTNLNKHGARTQVWSRSGFLPVKNALFHHALGSCEASWETIGETIIVTSLFLYCY